MGLRALLKADITVAQCERLLRTHTALQKPSLAVEPTGPELQMGDRIPPCLTTGSGVYASIVHKKKTWST